jgi:hypothetical protein
MASFRPNQDLGQVIAVEQRGRLRPFVALDALERLVAEDPSIVPRLLRVYRTVWEDSCEQAESAVYVLRRET